MLSPARPRVSQHATTVINQVRHATLIRRPKRPYTFTQLITLSDGSTFLHRTTSPQPVYRNSRDTKNHVLWNPSVEKLRNVEEDEAGRLKRFRLRFGRGFDAAASEEGGEGEQMQADGKNQASSAENEDEGLLDLISASTQQEVKKGKAAGVTDPKKRSGKSKGGEK